MDFHEKYPLFLSDFHETRIFSTEFHEVFKYKISLKSGQWEPSNSRRTDRQRETMKLIVDFRNFVHSSQQLTFLTS